MNHADRPVRETATPVYPETAVHDYEVSISKAMNGFIIRVGCKMFVAKTWEEASKGLGEYYKDPSAAMRKYLKK